MLPQNAPSTCQEACNLSGLTQNAKPFWMTDQFDFFFFKQRKIHNLIIMIAIRPFSRPREFHLTNGKHPATI